MAKITSAYFPPGDHVTINGGSYHGVPLAGKTGVVRGHADMAQDDVMTVVDLHKDHHFKVPNGTANPPHHLTGQPIHGHSGPEPREFPITHVEVPTSCLS